MALPIECCVPPVAIMSQWIQATYADATDEQRAIGHEWYALAHDYARTLSPKSVRIGAGVIAALSPQKSWSENKRLAKALLRGGTVNGQTRANIEKADRIVLGDDPLDVLRADERSWKAWSFYKLIAYPSDTFTVCVDRHAFDIATTRERLYGDTSLPFTLPSFLNRKGGYALIADAYRHAAVELECLPHAVQATTWIAWRANKRDNDSSFTEPF